MTMLVAGLYLSWLEPSAAPGKAFRYVRTWTGIVFFAAAVFVAGSGTKEYIDAGKAEESGGLLADAIAWAPYSEEILAEAKRGGKPVFIDSFADWCIPCKEMDNRTFNQPEVIIASRSFIMLKADLTRRSGPEEIFYKKYGVKGVPTLIFLRPDGSEIMELRGTGYEPKDAFLKKMNRALELVRGD
jgi:thiol:disulfide interchange protein DsbD